MEHTTDQATANAEEHIEFFGPTPEASESDWGVVQRLSPSGLASFTESAQIGDNQVSLPGNRKNRPGKISREVRDLQGSIESLSQDIAGKANKKAVNEALNAKVDLQEFLEVSEKLKEKADISQLKDLETVVTQKVSEGYQSPSERVLGGEQSAHGQSINAQRLYCSSFGHDIQMYFKWMAVGLAGASFCFSGAAIGRCMKQQEQIEQLRSTMNVNQQAYEKLKNKHLMVALNGTIDFDYVVSLEDQLKKDIQELAKALLSKAGKDELLKLSSCFKENAEELTEILQSQDRRPSSFHNLYVDTELREDAKHLGEILQGAAKYSESVVPMELEEHVRKLNQTMQEDPFRGREYRYNVMSKYPHINALARSSRSRL